MAIIAAELIEYLSGGAGNSNPNNSLGGIISTTPVTDNTTHNLWDVVSSAESSSGDTEYRCVYIKNTNSSLTLQSAKVWISSNTPSTSTSVRIALGTSIVGGQEQTIGNESTEPSGVSWSTAAGEGNALSIGDIASGSWKAIWIERVVNSSAGAYTDDNYVLSYSGDTAA